MRPQSPSLIVSSVVLNAGLVAAVGFGFLFHLMAARGLGPIGYGAFTASLTYVTLWAVVMEGGIGVALTREAAADPRRLAWAPRFATWRIRLGLVGAAGAVASAWLLRFDTRVVGLVAILAVGMVCLSAMRWSFAVFRVVGWFTWEAIFSTAQKVVLVLLTAGVLMFGPGPTPIAVAFTLSLAIVAIPAVARAWRLVTVTAAPRAALDVTRLPARFFLRTCVPLLAIELLTNLYSRVDQVVLLRLSGPEETGRYAVAYRVIEALLLLVSGTMIALFPRLAGSVRGAPDAFRADFVRAWRILWISGVVVAVNGWLWGTSLLPVIFGDAYAPARTQLAILLGVVPLAYVNYLLTQSLVAAGHERFYAAGSAVCAGVNLGLNVLLIPRWGATGAACVTILTEAVLLVICILGLRELGRIIPVASTLVIGAAASCVVAIGWWVLPDRPVERGVLALAVSVAVWEAAAPWPLRKLWAPAGPPDR